MNTRRIFAIATLQLLCVASLAHAQACPHRWAAGPLMQDLRGANGRVHTLLAFDPPGAPPPVLIIGGQFTHIGNIAANRIASWDGSVWRALGEGTDGPVLALTVFNNNLIVGGDFDEAGNLGFNSRYIAAWNGSAWFNLSSSGLGAFEDPTANYKITALAVFNNQLIAGGRIPIGSESWRTVFRLNGTAWEDITSPDWFGHQVPAPQFLQVFDEDGPGPVLPLLYAQCSIRTSLSEAAFQHWNGSVWTDLECYAWADCYAATITNGDGLVVGTGGGNIHCDHGNEVVDGYDRVTSWDGESWTPLGGGIGSFEYDPAERVTALREFNNSLYAAGNFGEAGGLPVSNMARWNGSDWFGTGIFFSGNGYRGINEMRVYNGDLVVGGDFNLLEQVVSGEPVNHLARFNGTTWSAFTTVTELRALATLGSRLVMGGTFNHISDQPGSDDVQYLAAWNGLEVTHVGHGVNGPVHALKSYIAGGDSRLVVGGEFTYAGDALTGINVSRIAEWSQPQFFPGSWSALGNGFNGRVLAIERYGTGTVAAGEFTAAGTGSPSFNRLARWSGSPPFWNAMGTGFNAPVRALKSYTQNFSTLNLVAGGDFTTANGAAANRIAIWSDTGGMITEWTPLGGGFNNSVHAIERHNNSTYAAGAFTASGVTAINHVARWNGSSWENVGGGLNGNVYALRSSGGFLYAACEVTVGGGLTASRWDGTSWTSLDGGVTDGGAYAILPYQTELVFGGSFERAGAGGVAVESPGLARYRLQGLPWIIGQPLAQSLPCGSTAVFSVILPTGYEGLVQYRWFKDGVPLSEGWTGSGSSLVGATTAPVLSVLDVSDADEGSYHLVVSNACGSVTTVAVTLDALGVCPPCPLDIAPPPVGNGVNNVSDLLMLLGAWGACPGCPPDFDGNGTVNVSDLLDLLAAWGFCP
jgi:hypothetical protein